MVTHVIINRAARKALAKAPSHIATAFLGWAADAQTMGLAYVRKQPGYHDEPLSGQRTGQRSIRLNQQWRAIYTETATDVITVTVVEVTAHDYRTRS